MADETFVTELLIDASQALRSLLDYQNGLKGAAGSTDDLTKEIANLNDQIQTVTNTTTLSQRQISAQEQALIKQSAAAGGAAGSILQLNKVTNDLTAAQAAVTRQMQTGAVSAEAGQAELAKLALQAKNAAQAIVLLNTGQVTTAQVAKQFPQVFTAVSGAFGQAANDIKGATTQFGFNRQGFLELQAAGINTFQALAAGMGVLRTAEMEGAQVVGALIQGQRVAVSTLLTWGAPIAAVVGFLGALAYTIYSTNAALKEFNDRLAVGSNVSGTGQQYDDLAQKLAKTGVSANEARTALAAFVTATGVNKTLPVAEAIGDLARNLEASRPDLGSFSVTFKAVTDAIAGGADGVAKLAVQYGHELPAALIIAMQKTGDLTIGLQSLANAFPDAATKMGFWSKVWNDIGNAWQDFAKIVADKGQVVIQFFNTLDGKIRTVGANVNKSLNDWFIAAGNSIVSLFGDTIPKAWNVFVSSLKDSPGLTTAFDRILVAGNAIATLFTVTLPTAWDKFRASLADTAFVKAIEDAFTSLGTTISNTIDNATRKASNLPGLGSMLDKLIGRQEPMGPPVPLGFAQPGLGSGQLPTVTTPTPAFGSGLIAPAGSPQAIIGSSFSAFLAANGQASQPYPSYGSQGSPVIFNQAPSAIDFAHGFAAMPSIASGTALDRAVSSTATGTNVNVNPVNTDLANRIGDLRSSGGLGAISSDDIKKQQDYLEGLQHTADAAKLSAAAAAIQQVRIEATAKAEQLFKNDTVDANGVSEREVFVRQAVASALEKQQNALQLNASTMEDATNGQMKIAAAYQVSAVAGLQAAAAEKARVEALTSGATATQQAAEAQRILNQEAAAALVTGQQNYVAGQRQLESNQAIAAAATQGVAAERDAQQQAAATAQTQDAVNKAKATGNTVLIAQAQALEATTLAQIKFNDAAKESTQFSDQARGLVDQQAVLQLQISLTLQGKTTDEIAKQVTLLQLRQTLAKANPGDDQAVLANLQAQTTATAQLTQNLQQAQQAEQRFEQGLVGIADTISSSIGTSIQNSFDNKTVLDWGATLKNVLAQIVNEIAQLAFIKPAIGSVLSLIGLQGAAQQFGTFGTLLNGIGSVGGAAASATGTGSGSSSGGVNIPNVPIGGLLNSSSGIGGFLNSTIGPALGLANPVVAGPTITGATLDTVAGSAVEGSGLFGSGLLGGASFTSLLGPIVAVGGLLATAIPLLAPGLFKGSMNYASQANLDFSGQISLSGQNQQNSQIAQSVLTGLSPLVQVLSQAGFQVPGVQATYGTKTGFQAIVAGDTTDIKGATTAQIAQHLLDVVAKLNPGFKTLADVLGNITTLQPTLDDTSKSFDDLSTIFTNMQTTLKATQDAAMKANLPLEDLNQRFQQLGQAIISSQLDRVGASITAFTANTIHNVSDFTSAFSTLSGTYQTAIAEANAANLSITTVSQRFHDFAMQLKGPELEAAISGLNDLFKALAPGQYTAALDQINEVFNSIFAQAVQFNAAGSDIWLAQDTAKANLRSAFNNQMGDLILGFTNPAALAIKQEKEAGAARVADAQAIGANVTQVNEYNRLSLQKVIDASKSLTSSANSAAQSIQSLVDALNQLKGGSLSGLTPGKQAESSFDLFIKQFKAGAGPKGDPAAVAQLGQLATAAVQSFQTAFGNTGMTEAYREVLITELNKAIAKGGPGYKIGNIQQEVEAALAKVFAGGAIPGFASGTMNTPSGAVIVGERGPELLIQHGGNKVVPLPAANQNVSGGNNNSVVVELKGLRSELSTMGRNVFALYRQVQGNQVQAHDDATQANQHLGTMKTAIVHVAAMPKRRVV